MRYYWLRDRQTQQQFKIYWDKGVNNDADYFTKHHATVDHCAKQVCYVKDKIQMLQVYFSQRLQQQQPLLCEGVLLPQVSTDGQTTA